jgi:uncharacterized protein YjbI with pentapeptide repeats
MNDIDLRQKRFKGNINHLNILLDSLEKDEIRIWNEWRLDNTNILPDLKGINLFGVNLVGIDLIGADLSDSDLSNADLSTSDLSGVVLAGATLVKTRLIHATIYGGGLGRANLKNADLDGAVLNNATLSRAILTGAKIRGISITGWHIEGIKCDYVFKDHSCKIREPLEGFYDPGEFEKLYQYSPKIEHIFIDEFTTIDILIMDKVVQQINKQNPKFEVKLDCFHARGKPRAEFVIKNIKDSKKILAIIQTQFEKKKREFIHKLELANMKAETYRDALAMSLKEPTFFVEQQVRLIDYKKIWLESKVTVDDNIEKLTVELSELRKTLKTKSATIEQDEAIGEIAKAEQAIKSGKGSDVIKHLRKSGKWVLDTSTTLGTNIVTELIKKSIGL